MMHCIICGIRGGGTYLPHRRDMHELCWVLLHDSEEDPRDDL